MKTLMGIIDSRVKSKFFFRFIGEGKRKGNYGDWHKKTQKLTILQPKKKKYARAQ